MPAIPLETVLVLGLATFRLARFIVVERGPFGVMERLRSPFGHTELFACVHCVGIYCAALTFALYYTPLYPVLIILAVAGFVSIVRDFLH